MKIKISIITIFLVILGGTTPLFAQTAGTPDIYTVTIEKVEFSTDGGSNYSTIKTGDQAIDIATVDAGQAAASYVSGQSIPFGTYNAIRVTVSGTFTVRGFLHSGGSTYFTRSAGSTGSVGFITTDTGDMTGYGSMSVDTSPSSIVVTGTISPALTIGAGGSSTMRVAFDLTDAIVLDTGEIVTDEPSITYSIQ